jgi:hypothetical protein
MIFQEHWKLKIISDFCTKETLTAKIVGNDCKTNVKNH